MKRSEYDRVCYRTEQRDESVILRNVKTGKIGFSFGCTHAGDTVQVRLTSGELDSWPLNECSEAE